MTHFKYYANKWKRNADSAFDKESQHDLNMILILGSNFNWSSQQK